MVERPRAVGISDQGSPLRTARGTRVAREALRPTTTGHNGLDGLDTSGTWVEIEGRRIDLPVEVRDACSASATYLVDAAAASTLLPGGEFEAVQVLPGRALFSLACIDYRDNDLGDYNEVSFALFVREKSQPSGVPYLSALADFVRGRASTYILWLPVDQRFTRDAGSRIWGFPKTLEDIDMRTDGATMSCTLRSQGSRVLTFTAPCRAKRRLPESCMYTYTHIDGIAHKTLFRSRAGGASIRPGGSSLDLGEHPMAEQLRRLGLPKTPLLSVWMEHMSASFEAPEAL